MEETADKATPPMAGGFHQKSASQEFTFKMRYSCGDTPKTVAIMNYENQSVGMVVWDILRNASGFGGGDGNSTSRPQG